MNNIYDKKDPDSLEKSVNIQNLAQAARMGLADLNVLIPLFVQNIQTGPQVGGNTQKIYHLPNPTGPRSWKVACIQFLAEIQLLKCKIKIKAKAKFYGIFRKHN